jgi:cell division protein FtsW
VALGLVMVYSASVALPEKPEVRQLLAELLPDAARCRSPWPSSPGCGAAGADRFWEKHAPKILFILALVLLVLVLIPGIGKVVNGSRRWIPLGVMNFQPSELAKLAMAMYAASYMVRKMDVKETSSRRCGPWPWPPG